MQILHKVDMYDSTITPQAKQNKKTERNQTKRAGYCTKGRTERDKKKRGEGAPP